MAYSRVPDRPEDLVRAKSFISQQWTVKIYLLPRGYRPRGQAACSQMRPFCLLLRTPPIGRGQIWIRLNSSLNQRTGARCRRTHRSSEQVHTSQRRVATCGGRSNENDFQAGLLSLFESRTSFPQGGLRSAPARKRLSRKESLDRRRRMYT
jgi:hypothetical protein